MDRSPNQIVLCYENQEVSFRELDALSNQVAHYLNNIGVFHGDVIAIFNDKSVLGYALMLGCLKIGAIYTHLDPDSPWARIEIILGICRPKKIFSLVEKFAFEMPCHVQFEKFLAETLLEISKKAIDKKLGIDTPAYLMFTSGSTGQPKGAIITHGSLLNFIVWAKDTYRIVSQDRFTAVNPMYFDNSVFDFYASVFNGATLLPVTPHLNAKPQELVSYLEKLKPTIWFSVPSFLILLLTTKSLGADNLNSIRYFIFGGEGFPKTHLKKLFEKHSVHARLSNVYGPTECTCICSAYEISESDFSDMVNLAPLGKIASIFDYQIVDGELILYGPNVGLGYYNNPEKTNLAFEFKEGDHRRARSYRTGDLVEENDGVLSFKGRKDFQIKHMGYRIELEEIEVNLGSILGVREVAVIYLKHEFGGKITAFVSLDQDMNADQIQDGLRKRIPAYMMPKTIHILEVLPKNQNGKIDRTALMNYEKK